MKPESNFNTLQLRTIQKSFAAYEQANVRRLAPQTTRPGLLVPNLKAQICISIREPNTKSIEANSASHGYTRSKYKINRGFEFKSVASLCELKAKLGLRLKRGFALNTKCKINRGFVFKSVASLCELKTKLGNLELIRREELV